MPLSKKQFLLNFVQFLKEMEAVDLSTASGKCSFKLENGDNYRGYIYDVGENIFQHLDDGLNDIEDPIAIKISDIDPTSFMFWDPRIHELVRYMNPNFE